MSSRRQKRVIGAAIGKPIQCTPLVKYTIRELAPYIVNKRHEPIVTFGQVPNKLLYVNDDDQRFIMRGAHLGQRKLLLNEIQFYTSFVTPHEDESHKNLIIYAGSASCEHLPIIETMFPGNHYLLIDPNFHSVRTNKYSYVYQNVPLINPDNLAYFRDFYSEKASKSWRIAHLAEASSNNRHAQTLFSGRAEYDMIFGPGKDTHDDAMAKIKAQFDEGGHLDLLKLMFDGPKLKGANNVGPADEYLARKMREDRSGRGLNAQSTILNELTASGTGTNDAAPNVFVIQDYLTSDLCDKLAAAIENYKRLGSKVSVYFITDIRTILFRPPGADSHSPSDIDLIWNNCLQIIFLKKLVPDWSMLKYRPPFVNIGHFDGQVDMAHFFGQYMRGKCAQRLPDSKVPITRRPYDHIVKLADDTYEIDDKVNFIMNMVMTDIGLAKDLCGVDYGQFFFNYVKYREDVLKAGLTKQGQILSTLGLAGPATTVMPDEPQYLYFTDEYIFLQPWQPRNSSESRLIVSRAGIVRKPFRKYSLDDWEDRYRFYNFYRSYAFHPRFHELMRAKYRPIVSKYDASIDCTLEILILACYLINRKKREGERRLVMDSSIAHDELRRTPILIDQILDLRVYIDHVTFYSTMNNMKTVFSTSIMEMPRDIIVSCAKHVKGARDQILITSYLFTGPLPRDSSMEGQIMEWSSVVAENADSNTIRIALQPSSNNYLTANYKDMVRDIVGALRRLYVE